MRCGCTLRTSVRWSPPVQPGRGRRGRGDDGLATLSWLLITTAVASLAALAVVLVQGQLHDTAQRISDSGARETAAVHYAAAVESDAKAASPDDFELWDGWESHFGQECGFIAVLYAGIEVEVVHNNFNRATGGTVFDAAAAGHAAAADELPATAAKAQVQCEVA